MTDVIDWRRVAEQRWSRLVELEAQRNALLDALKALRGDAWRHTVDWGPREERERIEAQCDAAIALAEPQREGGV